MARRLDHRQPNVIASQPATPQSCAGDLRGTQYERDTAAGRARDQLAFTGMAARGELAPDLDDDAEPRDS
jgi:hypothetical protein